MAVNNSLQKNNNNTIKNYIQKYEGEIAKALPKVMTPERFTRIATSAVSNNPKLAKCTPISFISALMNAAQLGLEPNSPLGQAYLIPYKDQCQFQIGYAGMLALAYRTKEFQTIYAETVYENDEFEYELGLDAKLVHKPAMEHRGKPIYFYAVYKLVNGGFGFKVMSKSDIDNHAKKYSKATSDSSPWNTAYEEMAKKTVLKQVLKYAPVSSDFALEVNTDETIKTKITEDIKRNPDEFYDIQVEEVDTEVTGEDLL